jgi:peptidyl-prolyl cis-trans isomerase A (cyclophilin A)
MKPLVAIVGAVLAALLAAGPAAAQAGDLPPGTYAIMKTNMGTMVFRLFPDQVPKTVENFIGLAEGTAPWTDPLTGAKVKKRLYDGTIFHRVIRDFMIQGGDPLGLGIGGPGYKFADESSPDLQFDRPYLLAMANSGPDTNGSQFFITYGAADNLNGGYTLFGEVTGGMDVVENLTPRDPESGEGLPPGDKILSVTISEN